MENDSVNVGKKDSKGVTISPLGAYKIGNIFDHYREIGDWIKPTSTSIRQDLYGYDQLFEYNGKIFLHSQSSKNIIEFRQV